MRGKLGFWEAFSIGVGGMIGGGIFAVLGLSLQLSDGAAPVAFMIAGLVALLTSYSYAKLASRYPSEGGTIEYVVQAFGGGLFSGWVNLLLLLSYIVMIALYTHAFASYGASLYTPMYSTLYTILAVFIVTSMTLVNLLGAKTSGRVELALVSFKLAILIFVVLVALGMVDWGRLSPSRWPDPVSIIAGGMIIFLAYEGFELVANAARDVSNTTILRRALYASVVTVIIVYVMVALVAAGTLDPDTVSRARDYALALVVEPVLGKAGFTLIVAAALASTSSAINATLYGTARISYMIARYGQAPRALGRRVWRGSYEGVILIAILSLALALGVDLEAISTAGSGGFLIVFTIVNLAAYKLRDRVGASPLLTLAGAGLSMVALALLVYRMYQESPRQLEVLAGIVSSALILEAAYRAATGRAISVPIDPELARREDAIRRWRSWLPRAIDVITSIVEAEIHLIGSLARGEEHRAGDVDIAVIPKKDVSGKEARMLEERITRELEKKLGLPRGHPLHIHLVPRRRAKRYLEKGHERLR